MEEKEIETRINEIEQKVEEKTQKLEKQNQQLKKEIQALKSDSNKISGNNIKASQGISRRQFLKKAGLGSVGLAALMSPVSSLDVDSNSFSVRTGSDSGGLEEYFSVGEDGPVNIKGTDLFLNGNDIDDVRNLGSAEGQYINLKNDSISLNFANDEAVRFYNYDTESTVLETSGDDVKIPNGNLVINTGQAIEDYGGDERVSINSGSVTLNKSDGSVSFRASDVVTRMNAYSDCPIAFEDQEGDFTPLEYQTSASAPGTLELTNANLDMKENKLRNSLINESSDHNYHIRELRRGSKVHLSPYVREDEIYEIDMVVDGRLPVIIEVFGGSDRRSQYKRWFVSLGEHDGDTTVFTNELESEKEGEDGWQGLDIEILDDTTIRFGKMDTRGERGGEMMVLINGGIRGIGGDVPSDVEDYFGSV